MDEKWAAVHEALARVIVELRGKWPVPYERTTPRGAHRGYCKERYRRSI